LYNVSINCETSDHKVTYLLFVDCLF